MTMNMLVEGPQSQSCWVDSDVSEGDVRHQIRGLLGNLYPASSTIERRHDKRYPFPHLVYLTPVAEDGVSPLGEATVVIGKHLSERGLGFYHHNPLPQRRMIVSLESADGTWLSFLIDLNWCRFTTQGWYESGGRFVQSVPSPI